MADVRIKCNLDLFFGRKDFPYSFSDFARMCGISRNALYNIRLGVSIPNLLHAFRIVHLLNVCMQLLGADYFVQIDDIWPDIYTLAAEYTLFDPSPLPDRLDVKEYNDRRVLNG